MVHTSVLGGALRGISHCPQQLPAPAADNDPDYPTVEATMVLDCRCGVGEGLFWDADSQLVRFLDIPGKQLWSYDPVAGATTTYNTPERPGTWAKCASENYGYIVAFETGFALYHPETGGTTRCDMGDLKIDPSNGGRLNDGRCDRQGRLVCGGYNDMLQPGLKQSSCYQVTPEGLQVRKLLDTPIACANSTCFSPDGTTMYFCDSPERVIWAYDYDIATGDATNRRDFIDFAARGLDGVPDGSTVDAQGGLWSCNITAGKVTRYDPDDASITCVVKIPHVSTPTCVALGGKDMTTLFITSLDGSLNQQTGEMDEPRAEEHAGSLFAIDLAAAGLPYSGLPEPLFAY